MCVDQMELLPAARQPTSSRVGGESGHGRAQQAAFASPNEEGWADESSTFVELPMCCSRRGQTTDLSRLPLPSSGSLKSAPSLLPDRLLRETGGAPRNSAPRNHFLAWTVKPSGCHCTDTFGGEKRRRVPIPLRSTSPFSDLHLCTAALDQSVMRRSPISPGLISSCYYHYYHYHYYHYYHYVHAQYYYY